MGVRNYTIIDIPMTSVAQAYFLGRTLGENNIVLVEDNANMLKDGIFICPPYVLPRLNDNYDLVLNVDSFTEMNESFQNMYRDFIKDHTNIFFSINHEQNKNTVGEIFANVATKTIRNMYPQRRGYLEETFFFK